MNTYEIHTFHDPQLPFIFHMNAAYPSEQSQNILLNWHENIEIFSVLNGTGILAYDDQRIPVRRGDLAVINSNHFHGLIGKQDLRAHCLIIDRPFCLANGVDTSELQLEPLFRDPEISDLFQTLQDHYRIPIDSPFRTVCIRAQILSILAKLCQKHTVDVSPDRQNSNSTDYIRKAIGYIRANYQKEISLEKTADFVGISKYYFAREFRRITGYTFVTHLNLTRCEAAKKLLSEDRMTIGAIALSCGFSGQSYFTRTFQSVVGMLPGEYRDRQKKQKK